MTEHWFWWCIMAACMVWYSTITVIVAAKGACDIRGMLHSLKAGPSTINIDVPSVQSSITPDS